MITLATIQLNSYVDYWKKRIHNELPQETIEQIEKFDSELIAADYADNTRKGYLYALHVFLCFVNKPLNDITKDDMTYFLNHLLQEKIKVSTRKFHNKKIARFFKWYNKETDLYVKFAKSTKELELTDWEETLPTFDEIERMRAQNNDPRNSALFDILVESGARIGEILRMTYGDVKINDAYIRISLRGRKTKRDIPIVWGAKNLMRWLDLHHTKNSTGSLWPNKNDNTRHLEYQGAYMIIKNLAKKANIQKSIDPKLFRHLRATILAKDPRIAPQIKKAYLGHSPHSNVFETTYTHFGRNDIVDEVLQSYGLKEGEALEQLPELKGEDCPRCGKPVAKVDKYCTSCWFVLDQEEALKLEASQKKPMEIINKLLKLLTDKLESKELEELIKESQ